MKRHSQMDVPSVKKIKSAINHLNDCLSSLQYSNPDEFTFSFDPPDVFINETQPSQMETDYEQVNSLQDLISVLQSKYNHMEIARKVINPLQRLNKIIGMQNIKEHIIEFVSYQLQHNESTQMNTLILGPSGVGKLQVAAIVCEVYNIMGLESCIVRQDDLSSDSFTDNIVAMCTEKPDKEIMEKFQVKFKLNALSADELTQVFANQMICANWNVNRGELIEFFTNKKDAFTRNGHDLVKLGMFTKMCQSRRILSGEKNKCVLMEDIVNGFERFVLHQ